MKKKFDAVEMMHRGGEAVRKKIAGMTVEQEVAYWAEITRVFREEQRELRAAKHEAGELVLRIEEPVILCSDISEHGLERGDVGTVSSRKEDSQYEVTFSTLDDEPVATVLVSASQIRPITHREIAHSRSLE